MKRVATIFAVLVVAVLCATAIAAVQSNFSIPIDQSVFIPCANGGAGDNVTLSGPVHMLALVTFTKDDAHVKLQANPQDVTGRGSVAGATYRATGVTRDDLNVNTANGFPVNETIVNNFRMISKGQADNFLVHETMHFTVNANGMLTANHDSFSVECR
jgi:hypothetical protein